MKVSVVIPLYNKGPYIKRALDSVLNQTFSSYEVIVVNDGSTDDGAAKISEYVDNNKVRLFHQTNKGVSAARNKGISEARGELIAFLDADDEWMPDYLETMVGLAKKYPQAGLVGAGFIITLPDGNQKVKKSLFRGDRVTRNYFREYVQGLNKFYTSSIVVPKYVITIVGGFLEGMEKGEDRHMWCKIALHNPIAITDKVLVIRHNNTYDRNIIKAQRQLSDFPILDYIEQKNIRLDEETFYYVKEYVNKTRLVRAEQCLEREQYNDFRNFLHKTRKTKEFKQSYNRLKKKYRKALLKKKLPTFYLMLKRSKALFTG